MENNMETEKIFKSKKSLLIIGLVILTIAVGLFIYSYIINKNKFENVEMHVYNDLISKNEDKDNMLVKLEITKISPAFATKEKNNSKQNFHFAVDANNYWYIVRLTDSTYKKLEKQFEEEGENFKYVLKGYIYNDPADLKRLAISAYNQIISSDAEKLTNSNFRNYLGNTYLDETITPTDDTSNTLMGVGIGVVIISSIFLIIYVSQTTKLKSTLRKYDIEELKEDLNRNDTISYKKQSVYLTNKYIISTINGLDVFEYKDILWVYNEKRRQNGVSLGVWLMVCTSNNKRIQIARASKDDILIEIMAKIKEKNQDILVGFTGENNKQYKELIKKIKNGEI